MSSLKYLEIIWAIANGLVLAASIWGLTKHWRQCNRVHHQYKCGRSLRGYAIVPLFLGVLSTAALIEGVFGQGVFSWADAHSLAWFAAACAALVAGKLHTELCRSTLEIIKVVPLFWLGGTIVVLSWELVQFALRAKGDPSGSVVSLLDVKEVSTCVIALIGVWVNYMLSGRRIISQYTE